jgi:hypothetical protein
MLRAGRVCECCFGAAFLSLWVASQGVQSAEADVRAGPVRFRAAW